MERCGEVRRLGAAVVCALFLGAISTSVSADANGRAGYSGLTGADCSVCHNDANATNPATVILDGPAEAAAGSINSYSFTISGGPGANAGFGINASDGILTDTNAAGTQLVNGELIHSTPGTFTNGSITYTFDWEAPATSGTYTIYASGVSGDGDDATAGDAGAAATLSVTVTGGVNQPPTAAISGPTTATAGVAVDFDASGSTDPDGTIASYDWDFGDGTAGAGQVVSHTFAAGTYTVMLTVTDDGGEMASAALSIDVTAAGNQAAPVADAGGPYTGTAGLAVQFDGSGSMDSDGTIATYDWDYGDGTTGAGVSPTHVYDAAGTYTVTLMVTDDAGLTGASQTTATIEPANTPPSTDPGTMGETLYVDNCESCHGPNGEGTDLYPEPVTGESAQDIMEAIVDEPDMQFLMDVITEEDAQAIADFLNPMPDLAEAQALYDANCASCHGPDGTGTEAYPEPITGESAQDIMEAIVEEPEMQFLMDVISEADAEALALFLSGDMAGPSPASQALYDEFCASCHGADGTGTEAYPESIVGEDAEDIMEAIEEEPEMMFLADVLTQEDIQSIADFLMMDNGVAAEDDDASSAGALVRGSSNGNEESSEELPAVASLNGLSLLAAALWVMAARRRRVP